MSPVVPSHFQLEVSVVGFLDDLGCKRLNEVEEIAQWINVLPPSMTTGILSPGLTS